MTTHGGFDHQQIQNAQRSQSLFGDSHAGAGAEKADGHAADGALGQFIHEWNEAGVNLIHGTLPEFKGTEPGVHNDGLNFHEADAAMGSAGLYASVFNKNQNLNPGQEAGIKAADAKLDSWLQAA